MTKAERLKEGNQLKNWRLDQNLNQDDMGMVMGVDRMTIYRWESGRVPMPEVARTLWAYMEKFGVFTRSEGGRILVPMRKKPA